MILQRIFNNSGDFVEKAYDPYRLDERFKEMHDFLFDEDGALHWGMDNQLIEFINNNNCRWNSDIVKLYWAQEMGSKTKGSYPAIYMWR